MFVPRALRLKGVQEKQRPKPSEPSLAEKSALSKDADLVDAMEGISTNSPEPQVVRKVTPRGSNITVRPITPEYIAQLAAGIELIFSDYAHQEEARSKWLQDRYRTVDGQETFVHLTAILENPNISTMKPEPTQILLQRALRECPSTLLELSSNSYYVRRNPYTYPPKFLPSNSFEEVNDDGLSFWDQRTIYVEPHVRNICQTPAKLAHWLKTRGQLKLKWLPIQATHMLYNSCAFIVLSGSVENEDVWSKWREAEKPNNWKIMTKVEHTKRTAEYIALLEKQNPKCVSKPKDKTKLPAIARPAALAQNVEVAPDYTEVNAKPKTKRKRNRRKGQKGDPANDQLEDDGHNTAADVVEEDEPNSKRRG
ncbi:hypothetical protein CC86DRAFT_284871 [Ophiobolus disseminans]|uniref:Uncharacterized protein n=1 Tax=Ophiobolus disseminans TaxID=1469910 RepID=A0A6A7A940_9PLEO|nr:hypothetical protein CC86DRAFT_284871 [Ophiobolus disseminans]